MRVSEEFLVRAKEYAKTNGFLNVQEFFREAARERMYDYVRPEYLKVLQSKEANTFLSEDESKAFEKELEERAKLE